jgi:hypothetical protein
MNKRTVTIDVPAHLTEEEAAYYCNSALEKPSPVLVEFLEKLKMPWHVERVGDHHRVVNYENHVVGTTEGLRLMSQAPGLLKELVYLRNLYAKATDSPMSIEGRSAKAISRATPASVACSLVYCPDLEGTGE